jgi:hypothetical protein
MDAVLGDAGLASNVLAYLCLRDAAQLRLASKLCAEAVATHPWDDVRDVDDHYFAAPPVRGGAQLARWRRCFPHARAVAVVSSEEHPLGDEHAPLLAGVRSVQLRLRDGHASALTPAALAGVVAGADRHRLALEGFGDDAGAALETLAPQLAPPPSRRPGRREVRLRTCGYLTRQALAGLAAAGARIVHVSQCELGDGALAALAPGGVEALVLHRMRDVGASAGASAPFAALGASLRALELRFVANLPAMLGSPAAAGAFFAGLPRLERLVLHGAPIRDVGPLFAPLAGLVSLNVYAVGPLTAATFASMPSLRRVTLAGCPDLTDAELARLPRGVRELMLSGCDRVVGTGLRALPELAELELSTCRNVRAAMFAEDAADAPGAPYWPSLRLLVAGGCPQLAELGALAPLVARRGGHLRELGGRDRSRGGLSTLVWTHADWVRGPSDGL